MLSAPIKMIISSCPCPSIFPLHLVKILNPTTWKMFTMYDPPGLHPNDLPHTGACVELALSSQHQHALFWEPMLVGTDFSVENQYSVVKSTVGTAVTEACKAINETISNKFTLTTHQGHAELCPAQTSVQHRPPRLNQGLLVGSLSSHYAPHEASTSPTPATFSFCHY